MTIELNPITSGYSTGLINDNFQAIEDYVNQNLLNRDGTAVGEANQMEVALDMNSHAILNVITDLTDPGSLVSLGDADFRYVNEAGDTMRGTLNMGGNHLRGLPVPVQDSDAARLVDVKNSLAGGTANLIGFTPYDFITATDVQAAVQQAADEINSVAGDVAANVTELGTKLEYAMTDAELANSGTVFVRDGDTVALPSANLSPDQHVDLDRNATVTGLQQEVTFRKGNLFSYAGSYEPTLGHIGHGSGSGDNQGLSKRNALAVTRGTSTSPDTTAKYANTAAYIELRTASVVTEQISSWGNPAKIAAITSEAIGEPGLRAELNGGAFRAYSTHAPTSPTTGERILVGMSSVAQTNTGAGNDSWTIWGANIVAAQTSGNAPNNCVGIEIDLVHKSAPISPTAAPQSGSNYTALWCQADGDGVNSTAGLYISRSTRSTGWNFGIYASTQFSFWAAYLRNLTNDPNARGLRLETSFGGQTGRVLECVTSGDPRFYVDGSPNNPVWVRTGDTMRNMQNKAFINLQDTDQVCILVN